MKKIAVTGSMLAAAVLAPLGVMGTAYAGDNSSVLPPSVSPPQSTTVQSNEVSDNTAQAASPESLPNTGGPDAMLLGGALALLTAGGATVVVARRRQTT